MKKSQHCPGHLMYHSDAYFSFIRNSLCIHSTAVWTGVTPSISFPPLNSKPLNSTSRLFVCITKKTPELIRKLYLCYPFMRLALLLISFPITNFFLCLSHVSTNSSSDSSLFSFRHAHVPRDISPEMTLRPGQDGSSSLSACLPPSSPS